jgi:hypothetical protein
LPKKETPSIKGENIGRGGSPTVPSNKLVGFETPSKREI